MFVQLSNRDIGASSADMLVTVHRLDENLHCGLVVCDTVSGRCKICDRNVGSDGVVQID